MLGDVVKYVIPFSFFLEDALKKLPNVGDTGKDEECAEVWVSLRACSEPNPCVVMLLQGAAFVEDSGVVEVTEDPVEPVAMVFEGIHLQAFIDDLRAVAESVGITIL